MNENQVIPAEIVSLHAGILGPLVARALGLDRVRLGTWEWTRLRERTGGGVFRVAGDETGSASRWSLVLKLIPPEGDSTSVTYPARERLAYASGLLDDLPGELAAPRCYRFDQPIEGRECIWLEDIDLAMPADGTLDRYHTVARHLGEFNGAYVTAGSCPTYPLATD